MDDKSILLELKNVYSGYGEIEVLKGFSLHVRRGQVLSVLGANGAGKSTLLKTISGIVRTTHGNIIFDGRDITRMSSIERLRWGISYVPEGRSNFPAMTVQENLEMGAYIRGDATKIKADIDALYMRFPIISEKLYTEVGNLSGGQQQIVEIAMALMLKPRIILIDEPTLGLAPILANEVFNVIKEINSSGTTVVVVEQNAKRALELSDFAVVLELGMVRFQGAAVELGRVEEIISSYLGER